MSLYVPSVLQTLLLKHSSSSNIMYVSDISGSMSLPCNKQSSRPKSDQDVPRHEDSIVTSTNRACFRKAERYSIGDNANSFAEPIEGTIVNRTGCLPP